MIVEIALGIVLGFVILANLRGLFALGILVLGFAVLLLLLGVAGWLLYTAFDALRGVAPLFRFRGGAATVASLVGGVLASVLFAFAVGQILQQRSSLSGREATVFGALFYVLFMVSVLAIPIGIFGFAETQDVSFALLVAALAGLWVSVVRQCVLRNRRRKRQVAG